MKAAIFSRRKSLQVTERFGALNRLKLMVTQLLLSPDLKGISNYLSQTPIFIRMGYMKENCVQLISVTSPEFQYGAADTISYFGKVEQIIPYSQALKEQYVSGKLSLSLNLVF